MLHVLLPVPNGVNAHSRHSIPRSRLRTRCVLLVAYEFNLFVRSFARCVAGVDEFVPLEGLAEELCDHAIRKGSTDNVSVVIVMLDPPPRPTNKRVIRKIQSTAREEVEKDQKEQKKLGRTTSLSLSSSAPPAMATTHSAPTPLVHPIPISTISRGSVSFE